MLVGVEDRGLLPLASVGVVVHVAEVDEKSTRRPGRVVVHHELVVDVVPGK